MTYNDGYKLKEWKEHYEEYKDDLDCFIIVDNGSDENYSKELEQTFGEETVIIKRGRNGGCTAAYNEGIRYALEKTDADAIIIIGNDIKVCKGCIPDMYRYLYSDKSLGIVSAAMLYIDSDIVEDFGHIVEGLNITLCSNGMRLSDLPQEEKYTDLVAGGFYMAKREYYETVGLQDEKLFMYSDELDTSIRTKKAGYKIGITSKVHVWHWHINDPKVNARKPASVYLIARNRVYLAKKHFGKKEEISMFFSYGVRQCIVYMLGGIVRRDKLRLKKSWYSFMGAWKGLCGNMELNQYTKF